MLRGPFEQESADQINSGKKDKAKIAPPRMARIGSGKLRNERMIGMVAFAEKAAQISDDNRNHAHQLPDETESPTVNDFQQQDNNG